MATEPQDTTVVTPEQKTEKPADDGGVAQVLSLIQNLDYKDTPKFLHQLYVYAEKTLTKMEHEKLQTAKTEQSKDSPETSSWMPKNLSGGPFNVPPISIPSALGPTKSPFEWWYYVGHVEDTNGNLYSVQTTITRTDTVSSSSVAIGESIRDDSKDDKYYYASKSDTSKSYNFHADTPSNTDYFIRYDNDGQGICQYKYIGSGIKGKSPGHTGLLGAQYNIYGSGKDNKTKTDIECNLYVQDHRGTVLEGLNGCGGQSYEIAQPMLQIIQNDENNKSTLKIGEKTIDIKRGTLWFDRQMMWTDHPAKPKSGKSKSGNALYCGHWMALQFDDGTSMMMISLMKPKPEKPRGTQWKAPAAASLGSIFYKIFGDKPLMAAIMPHGGKLLYNVYNLYFTVEAAKPWVSPDTGNTYGTEWTVTLRFVNTPFNWTLEGTYILRAICNKCENIVHGGGFWEGAVEIFSQKVSSDGIVESLEKCGHGFVEQMGFN